MKSSATAVGILEEIGPFTADSSDEEHGEWEGDLSQTLFFDHVAHKGPGARVANDANIKK